MIMCMRSRGRRSGCFFIYIKFVYNSCTKQKKPLISTVPDYVVEMMGVEPMSESISAAVSPSAADGLGFARLSARQQADRSAIPLFPCRSGKVCKVFLYDSMPDIRPTGKPELTRSAAYAASAKLLLLFLAFIFKRPFLAQTGRLRLASAVSTPPSKPLHPRKGSPDMAN